MTSYLLINNKWPEFVELLATRPITIHEMDLLNKTVFWFILNVIKLLAWFKQIFRDFFYDTIFSERSHP